VNRIATADHSTRSTAFAEAGARQKIAAVIMEKDFWVCWMLGLLFQHQAWRNTFVFKGGTSLSKVFGVARINY
jgi:predicted nucleotidyltransferase component of viral defense system